MDEALCKSTLRQLFLSRRKALPRSRRFNLDLKMASMLRQYPLSAIRSVMSYRTFRKMSEPEMLIFETVLRLRFPAIKICYPVIREGDDNRMDSFFPGSAGFTHGKFGIMEPKKGHLIDPVLIDLVLVPLLVCDMKGYRIGFGKGYYDRFLGNLSQDVVKIGISYFPPVQNIPDMTEFDIPLNLCITPKCIYEF